MAYLIRDDLLNKKQIKAALDAGDILHVYQPGPFGPRVKDGTEVIEAPKYPKPHRYYTAVVIEDGRVVRLAKPSDWR